MYTLKEEVGDAIYNRFEDIVKKCMKLKIPFSYHTKGKNKETTIRVEFYNENYEELTVNVLFNDYFHSVDFDILDKITEELNRLENYEEF